MYTRLAVVAACAFTVAAQTRPDEVRVGARAYIAPELRLRVQIDLVQLGVVVRDTHGHAVGGLKQSDFEIFDEGKPRAIAAFSVDARAAAPPSPGTASAPASAAAANVTGSAPATPPRSVLLFFDDLHTDTGQLRRTQNAAQKFVQSELGANTRVAIFASSEGLTLDFTRDPEKLSAAIERLRSHQRIGEGGLMPCPRISPYQAYLIANALDPSAMVAAVTEAHACTGADTTQTNPYAGGRIANGKTNSRIATDPLSILVQGQASQTWEQVRAATLAAYDALGNAMGRLAQAPGTRVLMLASQGFLSGVTESDQEEALIDRALRSGIVVNALDAKGLWSEPPVRPFNEPSETISIPVQTFQFEAATIGARNGMINSPMADFAAATGGLFFHNSNDLAGGFRQLGAVPEVSYLIAFHPDANDAPGKYHKLRVRLTSGKSEYVQTRPGYFAPSKAAVAEPGQTKLDREAFAADTVDEIPTTLAGRLGKTEKGDPVLTLIVHVDLAKLEFTERDGRQTQRLRFIGSLLDEHGNVATAKEGEMNLALKPETKARLTASGVNATLSLGAAPGRYRVRVVLEEAGGKMAAINQVVEIR